jgi:glutamate racemase
MTSAFPSSRRSSPIGVFDSGVGGLTVLRALRARLPYETMIYLGDTARVPYGPKSPETIVAYAREAAGFLIGQGIKLLVLACNTATVQALDTLRRDWPELPIVGVVEPGAEAAAAASKSGRIAVIATEGTIASGAYDRAILARRPDATVIARPAGLLVALAEEGWIADDDTIARAAAHRYLDPVLAERPDCLVLGCTHYPLLAGIIREVIGPDMALVDSSTTTAAAVAAELVRRGLDAPAGHASVRYLSTDGPTRFARLATSFLGQPVPPDRIELVTLSEQPAPAALVRAAAG